MQCVTIIVMRWHKPASEKPGHPTHPAAPAPSVTDVDVQWMCDDETNKMIGLGLRKQSSHHMSKKINSHLCKSALPCFSFNGFLFVIVKDDPQKKRNHTVYRFSITSKIPRGGELLPLLSVFPHRCNNTPPKDFKYALFSLFLHIFTKVATESDSQGPSQMARELRRDLGSLPTTSDKSAVHYPERRSQSSFRFTKRKPRTAR